MSAAELDILYSAYAAALEAANYDTAIIKLMAMQALLAKTPDLQHGLAGGQATRYRVTDLDKLIANCRKLKAEALAASVGIQRTKVTYARATE